MAYHLSKLGVTDVVLVERAMLSSGTTWHAAGLIGQLRDTETETKLSGVYGRQLLQNLEAETGLSTGKLLFSSGALGCKTLFTSLFFLLRIQTMRVSNLSGIEGSCYSTENSSG